MVAKQYRDIFDCVEANYPGFIKDIVDIAQSGGDISIQLGDRYIEDTEELLYPLDADTIVIAPVPAGSKGGAGKVILGVALVVLAIVAPYTAPASWGAGATAGGGVAFQAGSAAAIAQGAAIAIGANLAISGLQQLLAPDPSVDDSEKDYLFQGPETTTVGGNPVPVLLGEMMIGGIVISSGTVGGIHANDQTFVVIRDGHIDTYNASVPTDLNIIHEHYLGSLVTMATGDLAG